MGVLSYFDLKEYINKYNISTLIETGCGYGTGIKYSLSFPQFQNIYSCEIIASQAEKLRNEIKDNRLEIFTGKSYDFLLYILNKNEIKNQKSLIYWCDSHFGGFDLGINAFDAEKDLTVRLPLETELDLIYSLRPPDKYKDVILIDDIRIYLKMNFRGGNLEALGMKEYMKEGLDFIDKWKETHDFKIIEEDTGYGVLTPKY